MSKYIDKVGFSIILQRFKSNFVSDLKHVGYSPLNLAVKYKHYEVAKLLIENRANFNWAVAHGHNNEVGGLFEKIQFF
jgi:hypothetical protein